MNQKSLPNTSSSCSVIVLSDTHSRLSKVPAHAVRGALSTRLSGSSFAEVHRVLLSEPTHIEDEDEDQEDEIEDERDCEECRVSVEENQNNNHMKHGWDDLRNTP